MKTIEEKAKAYDEAIERYKTKQKYESQKVHEFIEYLFPELKESGDEKMRKELISLVKETKFTVRYYDLNKMLAWLEKQGEQELNVIIPKFKVGDKVVHKETGKTWTVHWYLADTNSYYVINEEELIHHYSEDVLESAEQKPVEKTTWYDNMDDLIADAMIDDIKNADMPEHCKHNRLTWINKHRSKPAAWSEEDEKILKDIITDVKFEGYNNDMQADSYKKINWLKSLRPQKQWKPSDGQIDAVKDAIDYLGCNTKKVREYLMSLYEQLKKLKG